MSHSANILSRQELEVKPQKWGGDELTIRVWAILQIQPFIERIGWIEHTNDWDLAFEITVGDTVYFSMDVVPLNSKGEPFTMENGVNDQIVALRLDDWFTNEEGSDDKPITFQLSEISRIYFG